MKLWEQRNLTVRALVSLACVAGVSACAEDSADQATLPIASAEPSASGTTPSAPSAPIAPDTLTATPPGQPPPVGAPTNAPLPSGTSPNPAPTVPPNDLGAAGAGPGQTPVPTVVPGPVALPEVDGGVLPTPTLDAGPVFTPPDAGSPPEPGVAELPDPGPEGNGDYDVGPNYGTQPELENQGAPRGQTFRFSMALADSEIFDGQDSTLDPSKPVNQNRGISVYVPAAYEDGTPAAVLVIQDGDGPLGMVSNALDNLTGSDDPDRRLPPFIAVAVQNGGNDAQGSERGLEYDTMSDRYARFIDEEVLPAVEADPGVSAAYPNLRFTRNPSGRAALGCSSGGAAAFTMGWFRPDLFSRIVAYSTTLVDQQNHSAPEAEIYPHGAWDYHSELELIANSERKPLRIFLNVNENDLRANDAESTLHNWVMANERTAEDLAAKDYNYRYVFGLGAGHCDAGVQQATLADALVWVWRGYVPTAE